MPLAKLREFARELATRRGSSYRKAARRFGLSPTGLKEFVEAETDPQERTLRKIAEVQREDARERGEAEPRWTSPGDGRAAPRGGGLEEELRGLVPAERDAAVRWTERIFAPGRREPDGPPPGAVELEAAVLRWIERRDPPEE